MQIVVSDTNIFLDLIHAELIDLFFQMPLEVHTTDFVINEIEEPDQEEIIDQLIGDGRLYVANATFEELEEINTLQESVRKLSIPDCSVWHYSKKHRYTLITGDNLLRRTASKDQVSVKGILYIFDDQIPDRNECDLLIRIVPDMFCYCKLSQLNKLLAPQLMDNRRNSGNVWGIKLDIKKIKKTVEIRSNRDMNISITLPLLFKDDLTSLYN